MPIYAYKCESCGHAKDVLQKMSDAVLTDCPACGASTFKKQLTAAGFQLKGSGWYVTDFKGGAAAPGAAPGDKSGATSDSASGTRADAGTADGQAAGKSESKAADSKTEAKASPASEAKAVTKTEKAAPTKAAPSSTPAASN